MADNERGLGQVLQGSTAFCISSQQRYSLLCSLKLQKPYVIGYFLHFILPPALPISQPLGAPDSMLLQQLTSKLQWSHIQGAASCLAPHYLIFVHLLMTHSRKLARNSDDASTAQIPPSERCVQSNSVVRLTRSCTRVSLELTAASDLPPTLPFRKPWQFAISLSTWSEILKFRGDRITRISSVFYRDRDLLAQQACDA